MRQGQCHQCGVGFSHISGRGAVPALCPAHQAQSKAAAQRKASRALRMEVLGLYGGVCARCGFSDERALQIDHVQGGGYTHRKAVGSAGVPLARPDAR